jgi:hypothetical protein
METIDRMQTLVEYFIMVLKFHKLKVFQRETCFEVLKSNNLSEN